MHLPKYEKELVPNVKAHFRPNGDLDLTKLIQTLKLMDYPVDMNMIFYYSHATEMYIYCGKEPLHPNTIIPAHEIVNRDGKKEVTTKFLLIILLGDVTYSTNRTFSHTKDRPDP